MKQKKRSYKRLRDIKGGVFLSQLGHLLYLIDELFS